MYKNHVAVFRAGNEALCDVTGNVARHDYVLSALSCYCWNSAIDAVELECLVALLKIGRRMLYEL